LDSKSPGSPLNHLVTKAEIAVIGRSSLTSLLPFQDKQPPFENQGITALQSALPESKTDTKNAIIPA
jgi:hypothetical protein